MPLGDFEKSILRLLAANRNPESYVAGATVFLRREDSPRRSQHIDVFHDTAESLRQAAAQDAAVLEKNGHQLEWTERQDLFRRAVVSKAGQSTKMEWAYDSAFRFFPVQSDAEFGFVLHPLDSATNKLLALAGRGELRDYLDVLFLHRKVLSLGALAWAACGKDSGFTPQFLIEEAQRLAHYPAARLKRCFYASRLTRWNASASGWKPWPGQKIYFPNFRRRKSAASTLMLKARPSRRRHVLRNFPNCAATMAVFVARGRRLPAM